MVDVLEPLTAHQTDLLANRIQERPFGRGETVYAPGDASEAVFVLLEGRMRLYGMAGPQELTWPRLSYVGSLSVGGRRPSSAVWRIGSR